MNDLEGWGGLGIFTPISVRSYSLPLSQKDRMAEILRAQLDRPSLRPAPIARPPLSKP